MRKNVSSDQNIWINSGEVDSDNLILEQNYVNNKISSIVDNHLGSGVLPDSITRKILFDSSTLTGTIDGIVLNPSIQPSDDSYGNQIELELSNSACFSLRTVKVAVFGLNFENTLIYETFTFSRNESQIGKLHFKNIISIIVNDISGPTNLSLNLGGTLKIYEAKQSCLSRDCLTSYQNIQPNLFWRNFFTVSYSTLEGLLSAALPGYDLDQLNIFTSENNVYELAKNNITTELGQKFKSQSTNIQKIRLLLSVENNDPGDETDLEWTGDLIVSIYPLQSKITCPSDIVPNLEIEFDPVKIPLAQLSLDFTSLKNNGFVLTNSMQPVDFIFSNSNVATGKSIEKDKFYCLTIKRSGAADKCDIKIYSGQDLVTDSRITVFNGNYWSDITSEDFWYEIYSDSAKVTSASIYEDGFGINIDKVKYEDLSGVTSDYCLDKISFSGNSIYTGIVYSKTNEFDKVEDKRTGSQTYSKQNKIPAIELLNQNDLNQYSSNILKFGVIADKNLKYKSSNISLLNLKNWCFVKNEIFIPLIEDSTDPRYDGYYASLKSSFLNGEIFKSKIIPDTSSTSIYYRVGEAQLEEMIYGDVNGDCIIDQSDVDLFNLYEGLNLNKSPQLNSSISFGPLSYSNGYLFLTNKSVSKSSLTYYIINKTTNTLVDFGSDAVILPESGNIYSQITSPSGGSSGSITSQITSNSDFIIYLVDTDSGNNGFFEIREANVTTQVLRVSKKYMDAETMLSMYRANINNDFVIDGYDGYLLQSYLERNAITSSFTLPYPAPTTNAYNKIGTKFNVLRLKLEKFEDTHDDQYSSTRSENLHIIQDVFTQNTNLQNKDLYYSNISSTITPQLVWEDYLVVSKSEIKIVPNIISSSSGFVRNECLDKCPTSITYPQELSFDPGINDQFIPNNLIIGDGQILNKDKSMFKVDFEVGTLIIEVPDNFFGTEKTINVFSSFVCEHNNSGKTIDGFTAMKFADCTFVQSSAIVNEQVKFSVSIQSFSPILDGYEGDSVGVIVDPKMGVYIDSDTGLLRLNFTNIYKDLTKPTLSTKIQINVFLKKAGFNNKLLTLSPELVNNLFV